MNLKKIKDSTVEIKITKGSVPVMKTLLRFKRCNMFLEA